MCLNRLQLADVVRGEWERSSLRQICCQLTASAPVVNNNGNCSVWVQNASNKSNYLEIKRINQHKTSLALLNDNTSHSMQMIKLCFINKIRNWWSSAPQGWWELIVAARGMERNTNKNQAVDCVGFSRSSGTSSPPKPEPPSKRSYPLSAKYSLLLAIFKGVQ